MIGTFWPRPLQHLANMWFRDVWRSQLLALFLLSTIVAARTLTEPLRYRLVQSCLVTVWISVLISQADTPTASQSELMAAMTALFPATTRRVVLLALVLCDVT